MGVQILEEEAWVPPLVVILFGPPGSWKTSTLGCAEGAVWGDFHGSTKTFQRKPRRLSQTAFASSSPGAGCTPHINLVSSTPRGTPC